jgi:hypothetical protein
MSRTSLAVHVGLAVTATALALPVRGDVQAALKRADSYRLAAGAVQVTTHVELSIGGKVDKERDYLVYSKPNRRSLVLSRSPVEKGQKILMIDDDYWIVMPTSERPIRITPTQKLLGDASTGDIATMTWTGDYDGTAAGDEDVGGVPCTKLDLKAQRKGVTYARIELYVAKSDGHPVQADLYVASDRIAKHATFEMGSNGGAPAVVSMTLVDRIQTNRQTVIRYVARASKSIDDAYYNPMYLTHHEPQ